MELLLTSDATTVFLDPYRPNVVQAQVHLIIPADVHPPTNRLESLSVTLLSKESLSFPGGYLEARDWHPTVSVPDVGRVLLQPGGTYTWEVRLKIPDDMPSYERSRSGFCFQSLRAEAVFGGLRFFRKSLQAQKSIFLVPQPESDQCFVYDHFQTGVGEGLGPVTIHAQSRHLTVGGALHAAAQIPAPAPDCKLDAIELTLVQSTKLHSRRKRVGQAFAECAKKRIRLLRVEGEEGCELMQWTCRMPSDTEMRPSTSRAVNAIQISHNLEARFDYRLAEAEQDDHGNAAASASPQAPLRRAFVLSWPIHVPSCALRPASIHLPLYSALDPSPVPDTGRDVWTGKNEHLSHDQCVCGQSMEEVLAVEQDLARAHGLECGNEKVAIGCGGEEEDEVTITSTANMSRRGSLFDGSAFCPSLFAPELQVTKFDYVTKT